MCCAYLPFHHHVHQTDEWRLSDVNKDFSVCPSYPSLVAVPKNIDDEALRKVATFRQGGRFPVLSYYHRKNGMVSTQKWHYVWRFSCSLIQVSSFRWWCEQGSPWQAPTGADARKTRNWSMPPCGRASVVTSSTHAPLAWPSRPKLEVEALSLRLTIPSGGRSIKQSRGV